MENRLEDLAINGTIIQQKVLGRTNRLISFDITWTAQKTKRLWVIQTHREHGDLISLLTKIRGDTQTESKMIYKLPFMFSKEVK
jgi:hypothetical protein